MSSKEDTKFLYEVAKATNTTKQLIDDFSQSIALFSFKDYFNQHPNSNAFLEEFMDDWESHVLAQKLDEIASLTEQNQSMFDMAAGATLANSEDLETFKKEVAFMKELFALSIID